jgi:hypothetical protein
MGCDIHLYGEKRNQDGTWEHTSDGDDLDAPMNYRSYGIFGFLAGVRNYSAVTPISRQRGLPDDTSAFVRSAFTSWRFDAHSPSWMSMDELMSFDYEGEVEDRRCTRNGDGGSTCEPGNGKKMTYREFLGDGFFKDLERLRDGGADRVVFWFDN